MGGTRDDKDINGLFCTPATSGPPAGRHWGNAGSRDPEKESNGEDDTQGPEGAGRTRAERLQGFLGDDG